VLSVLEVGPDGAELAAVVAAAAELEEGERQVLLAGEQVPPGVPQPGAPW
jgi:hypothetical protein